METIVVGTQLMKSATVDLRRSVLLTEVVQLKDNARVIKKARWCGRNGTLHSIFLLKANGV